MMAFGEVDRIGKEVAVVCFMLQFPTGFVRKWP
jgi:hypothetical protein